MPKIRRLIKDNRSVARKIFKFFSKNKQEKSDEHFQVVVN